MGVRWGILGTGYIAELFAADLQHAGAELIAVGSRGEASARSFADRFGIRVAHADYRALCDDPSVEAVYVASPNPFHAEHALMALRAGKHVLLEKPFTMTTDDARTVIDEAAAHGLVVMEAMWTRFLPHMVRAREIVTAGMIGEVRALEANLSQTFTADHRGSMRASVMGTLGRIEIDDAWHRASSLSVFDNGGALVERFDPVVAQRGMQFEAEAFESLITDGVTDGPVMPHEQTLAVLNVITDIRDRFMAEQEHA